MSHRVVAVVGERILSFADFGAEPDSFDAVGNEKGVFIRDRRSKAAAPCLPTRRRTLDRGTP
jgi:hypothetical protein